MPGAPSTPGGRWTAGIRSDRWSAADPLLTPRPGGRQRDATAREQPLRRARGIAHRSSARPTVFAFVRQERGQPLQNEIRGFELR